MPALSVFTLALHRLQNTGRPPHAPLLVSDRFHSRWPRVSPQGNRSATKILLIEAVACLICLFPGLQEVVVVVQSQRNSYHARRGEQRKAEILQQAANLGKVTGNQSEARLFISCSSVAQASVYPSLL